MEEISVGVDLDGVLRNFYQGVVQALEEHRPDLRPFVVDDPRDVSSINIGGMMAIPDDEKQQEIRDFVFETKAIVDVFGKAPAYEDDLRQYRRGVSALREVNANVLICTSQHKYAQKFATVKWLYKRRLDFDGLIMAHSNKGQYGLDWHIDDKQKNVAAVTRESGQGVLRARPGNFGRRRMVKHVVHSFEDYVEMVIDSQT